MNQMAPAHALTGVSDQEWALRCDLAALYRLVAHFRMTDFIYTHLSVRVPGPEHHFLINRYGVLFHEMRASDLVKIDLHGKLVEQGGDLQTRKVNAAGFTIHSAIHMARPDLLCVMHTHTAAGIAISSQKRGLLPMSQQSMKFYNRIGYHDYEGVALDLEERDRLVADLGQHDAMILRNHGLLVGGSSIADAFLTMYTLERACQAQMAAMSCGEELIIPPAEVCEHAAGQLNRVRDDGHLDMAWSAALRLVENDKPDYRS